MANKNIMVTDPIADMLTRMRNALNVRRDSVEVPYSKIKMEIAKILVKEGYLERAENAKNEDGYPIITITFKIRDGAQRVIQGLRRISKPGLRCYTAAADVPKVLSGLGTAIISTSKGIMTDKDAREKNLGGEVLAYVW